MLLKIKEIKDYEKTVQLLRVLGIEFEEEIEAKKEEVKEMKEAEIYQDRVYRWDCPYCGDYNNQESYEFEKAFNKETSQITCACGQTSKASIVEY